ncbi:hypothetical protein J010_02407 [Cryptococcus neoformans]|nr:hypothetical protein C355_02330 [Cryptococcus neoformans var. grubii Th84]OXG62236.1 hypothetical protein C354_02453 [Cryptococcus neoformans var. grubii MW-RSA1955]OXG65672.1 hypothetical protein C351_02107 [Cryptococcus neoformans var. grubii c8]OXG67373.1 hypothetical protein C352_02460 [Cryptococcus neoformans var. grubii CHC193]OXG83321.1 hypothetical protein C350_02399 [Cryptococcus neoformans var. grubii MW-RSA36]OXH13239.1 hypothetical protein J010_02407 [Cryptococcus neoformans var
MSETPPVPLPERKRTSSPLHNPPSTKRAKRGPQGVGMGGHVTESDLVKIVHETVRILCGMPAPNYQGNLAPDKWPAPDPINAKDGRMKDEQGKDVWRPDWGKLGALSTMNFVVHATIACRNHPQYHESITDSILTDRVKKYIQSIHKGRKKTPTRKEAKNDRRAIRERQRRLQDFIVKHFDDTPLGHCREHSLLREAFKPNGILSTLRIIHHSQVLQHGLRTVNHSKASVGVKRRDVANGGGANDVVREEGVGDVDDDQYNGEEAEAEAEDEGEGEESEGANTLASAMEQAMGESGQVPPFDEFQIYTDAWWGEAATPFYASLDVWWWSDLMRWAVWTAYECYRLSPISSERPPPAHLPIEKIDLSSSFRFTNSPPRARSGPGCPSIWACPGMIDYPTVQSINPTSIPPPTSLPPNPLPSPSDLLLPPLKDLLREPQYGKLYISVARHLEHPRLLSDDQLAELWVLRQNMRTRREYEFALGSLTGDGKRRRIDGEGGLLRGLGLGSGSRGEGEGDGERAEGIIGTESVEENVDREIGVRGGEGNDINPELVAPSLPRTRSAQPGDISIARQAQGPQTDIHSGNPATLEKPEQPKQLEPGPEPELGPEQSQLIGLEAFGEVVDNAIHAAALAELKKRGNSDDEVDEEMEMVEGYDDISF